MRFKYFIAGWLGHAILSAVALWRYERELEREFKRRLRGLGRVLGGQ